MIIFFIPYMANISVLCTASKSNCVVADSGTLMK